jgi:restriction endonuclease
MEVAVDLSDLISDWAALEHFVKGMYRGKDEVQVQRDVRLPDNDGGRRQIDVLVTVKRMPHVLKIVVECKRWNKPVERAQIDKLLVTVQKTNAAKGVIFTTKSYQKGALNTAQKNGVDAFLVRAPRADEMSAINAGPRYLQLCSCVPEDKVQVPNDSVEVGANGPWPRGISLSPSVRFGKDRTTTPILNRTDRKSLEDLIGETARNHLSHAMATVGVIGDGKDCVGHFSFRCDLVFKNPILIQERTDPLVLLRIQKLSVNIAVKIEQRLFDVVSQLWVTLIQMWLWKTV